MKHELRAQYQVVRRQILGGPSFQVNLDKKHKTLTEKQQIRKGLDQTVECLPSKPKALSLILL
jgi:hypothetical protein